MSADQNRDVWIGEVRTDVKYIRGLMDEMKGHLSAHDGRISSLEETRTRGYGLIIGLGAGGGVGGAALWQKIIAIMGW